MKTNISIKPIPDNSGITLDEIKLIKEKIISANTLQYVKIEVRKKVYISIFSADSKLKEMNILLDKYYHPAPDKAIDNIINDTDSLFYEELIAFKLVNSKYRLFQAQTIGYLSYRKGIYHGTGYIDILPDLLDKYLPSLNKPATELWIPNCSIMIPPDEYKFKKEFIKNLDLLRENLNIKANLTSLKYKWNE
jgi:hypothetical protein